MSLELISYFPLITVIKSILKYVSLPPWIISSVCNSTDRLQTYSFGQSSASSSRLCKAGCPSNVAHESKLQKASVDLAVRSGLLNNIQESELHLLWLQKQRKQRHQQITHLSIMTGNFCRIYTQFIINKSINHQ